ncbi:hypothetical protein DAPPUDRAFT_266660 [Daphnia pulex]|uniref:Uncharacterized protein n=1 Tax=Daphnia pulex TaxID=6669 RepID=E9HVE2_DAPPU|nr:hypothetical protein DAPPUDRAFT_266660 [Daphnia pulex]|eukprot:EFX64292.1 hypothetical protein DAPPUDRAFT_266660 [Daphnia pulex]
MAGRGRLLLEPGFVYDEVNLTPPPQVSRVFDWPRPNERKSTLRLIFIRRRRGTFPGSNFGTKDSGGHGSDPLRETASSTTRFYTTVQTPEQHCNSLPLLPAQQLPSPTHVPRPKKSGPCARPAQLTKAIHHRPGGTQTAICF